MTRCVSPARMRGKERSDHRSVIRRRSGTRIYKIPGLRRIDLNFPAEALGLMSIDCGGQKSGLSMDTLKGHFLIATPDMSDERFTETVIYLVAHGEEGAMGLVVNKAMPGMQLADILSEIDTGDSGNEIRVPAHLMGKTVLQGGPVDSSRGFVLHTADYFRDGNSFAVDEDICLTATLDVLRAMVDGTGPEQSLLALGYCGWSAGQLEEELRQNGWLVAERSDELLFETPLDQRYDAALAAIGVTRATLSPHAGSA